MNLVVDKPAAMGRRQKVRPTFQPSDQRAGMKVSGFQLLIMRLAGIDIESEEWLYRYRDYIFYPLCPLDDQKIDRSVDEIPGIVPLC